MVGKLTQKTLCRMLIIYDINLLIGNCQYYSISYDTRSSVILYHCKTMQCCVFVVRGKKIG